MRRNKEVFKLALAATLIAITFTLDIVTGIIPGLNISMPLGGRILGISLLPLALIGFWLGFKYGLIAGIMYGVISFFYDGYSFAYFASNIGETFLIFMLDYVIAFAGFSVTGLFRQGLKKRSHFVYALIIAFTIRWASSTVVGAILWATFATGHEWTNNLYVGLNSNGLLYSGIYNMIYNITSFSLVSFIGLMTFKQLGFMRDNYIIESDQ